MRNFNLGYFNFLIDNALILAGFLLVGISAWVSYHEKKTKHQFYIFLLAVIGLGLSGIATIKNDQENKKTIKESRNFQNKILLLESRLDSSQTKIYKKQVETEEMQNGGDAYPIITLEDGGLDSKYAFYLSNYSNKYSIDNVDCRSIPVSSDSKHLLIDEWPPQVAIQTVSMQPRSTVKIDLQNSQGLDTNLDLRYNFFIVSRNGYFREQMLIRHVGDEWISVCRVLKDSTIVHESETPDGFLKSGETKIVYQDPNEGLVKYDMVKYSEWMRKKGY